MLLGMQQNPRYLTTTRTLECKSQAIYLQYSMLIPQMESGFPRKRVSNVHDSGQVCMIQGKNGRNFKAFTSPCGRMEAAHHVTPLWPPWGLRGNNHLPPISRAPCSSSTVTEAVPTFPTTIPAA